jgi:Zn finger protein HypA/HybF involved in hydrogenase expression
MDEANSAPVPHRNGRVYFRCRTCARGYYRAKRGIEGAGRFASERSSRCKRGHLMDESNTGRFRHGEREVRHCRECARQRGLARRRRLGVSPKARGAWCKRGHALTVQNSHFQRHANGEYYAQCKTCARDRTAVRRGRSDSIAAYTPGEPRVFTTAFLRSLLNSQSPTCAWPDCIEPKSTTATRHAAWNLCREHTKRTRLALALARQRQRRAASRLASGLTEVA